MQKFDSCLRLIKLKRAIDGRWLDIAVFQKRSWGARAMTMVDGSVQNNLTQAGA